ncbi:MAG: 3-hydroxy-3-isohexenylglutaryl-CoA/hydroxy-methylglutaryl-CoA lyase [Cellvibrionales bacterium UBA7375]|nr:MAG: 3-hydroxy-3-isohexenylglutaryl-CoA/hydroxy-methylglutaryl-CoA lyase [Cellvibrionales bacterium UBA7375]
MSLPKAVRIVEVGPRDGLQNESVSLDVATKVELIHGLADAGLQTIEAGSFVSPKWVPQMAGSDDVFKQLNPSHATYTALIPNMRGLERAIECNVKEIAVFAAASEAFSQKNINCSIDESLEKFKAVTQKAKEHNIAVRGYISCVSGCPYQGDVDHTKVSAVAQYLLEMGCYEISLGDTIGVATPDSIEALLTEILKTIEPEKLAVHLHDTYGQAIANIKQSLIMGISIIDSSVAGLGGCPYAKGASGNVATEHVIQLLNELGIEHGINLEKLNTISRTISQKLGHPAAADNGSKSRLK